MKKTRDFIVGRYEAGKDTDGSVVVKKNKPVYGDIKWGNGMNDLSGGAVEKSVDFVKNTYTSQGKTVGVVSTLIYGGQWDATLKFFNNEEYRKDSTGKGNYSSTLIKTGSNENYKIKNIYDMAGNADEWTMEGYYYNYLQYRSRRGGSVTNKSPSSFRKLNQAPTVTDLYTRISSNFIP